MMVNGVANQYGFDLVLPEIFNQDLFTRMKVWKVFGMSFVVCMVFDFLLPGFVMLI